MRSRLYALFAALSFSLTACTSWASDTSLAWRPPAYPLDDVSRSLATGEKLACELGALALTAYRGDVVRYQRPVRVHPAFRTQLAQFEAIVAELGRRYFGRAPRSIVHFGAYVCRPMRNHAYWLSEHALGNAIDVAGFDFGPLAKRDSNFALVAKPLRKSFSVRVDKDWHGNSEDPKRAFLHALADRLIARPDIFRSLVGPDYPGHANHLHLAHPPYRLVKIGSTERWWFW